MSYSPDGKREYSKRYRDEHRERLREYKKEWMRNKRAKLKIFLGAVVRMPPKKIVVSKRKAGQFFLNRREFKTGNKKYRALSIQEYHWRKTRIPCPLCSDVHILPEQFRELAQISNFVQERRAMT